MFVGYWMLPGEERPVPPPVSRLMTRCRPILAVILTTVVLAACINSGPTTRASLCQKFDALGKEMLSMHLFSDNAVFRRAGDMADSAERYEASSEVEAEARRIRKIADSDSTSPSELLNATQAVADVCGHPLGLGSSSP